MNVDEFVTIIHTMHACILGKNMCTNELRLNNVIITLSTTRASPKYPHQLSEAEFAEGQ